MTSSSDKTSFLQSLLPSSGKSDRNTVSNRIKEIEKNILILQKDVCETMDGRVKNFERFDINDQKELSKCQEAVVDMDELSAEIDNDVKAELTNSTGELIKLKESLKETSLSLSLLNQLLCIKNFSDEAVKSLSNGKYVAAASCLEQAKALLDNPTDDVDQLFLFAVFRDDWSNQHSSLTQTLFEEWGNYLSWEKSGNTLGTKTISLKVLNSDTTRLSDVVRAFYVLFESSFYRFGKTFLHDILIPIITQTAEVEMFKSETSAVISIAIKPTEERPTITSVIENIMKVVAFVNTELDFSMEDEQSFPKLLGSIISKEFNDTLIKECLMNTLPSSRQEMNAYSDTLGLLSRFASDLKTINFLEADSILEYIENVDNLFVGKTCAVFLEKARSIMKKDLHDSISVKPEKPTVALHEIIPEGPDDTSADNRNKLALKLQEIFSFPACHISKWTLDLEKLIEQVLQEALEHKDEDRSIFYQTARNIIVLYTDVVPVYHEKFLESIPQLVALFHNNCIYLAHRLLTLGFEHQSHLATVPEKNQLVFVDLVQPLRTLGSDAFLARLQFQRKQMLDLTKNSGLATIGESPNLPPTIEKSIRSCLRQFEHLNSVWRHILPSEVYNKSMGGLLNAWIGEIIARVCSAEDISASAVNELIRTFSVIVQRAPKVFEVENEIVKHVKQWSKFQELIKVLGCTLKEIEERWMQGAGTLAYEFTAEQVKHLIRAIFQNTGTRASVLGRIE